MAMYSIVGEVRELPVWNRACCRDLTTRELHFSSKIGECFLHPKTQ